MKECFAHLEMTLFLKMKFLTAVQITVQKDGMNFKNYEKTL